MKATQLLEEWESGESTGMRAQRVKTVREYLMEHTDMFIPRRISEIESFMSTMKGQVTRRLREAAEEEQQAGSDEEDSDPDEDVGDDEEHESD